MSKQKYVRVPSLSDNSRIRRAFFIRRGSLSVRCVLVSRLLASRPCMAYVDARRQYRNSGAAGINLCGVGTCAGPHPDVEGWYPRIGALGGILWSREASAPCKTVLEVNDNSGRRIPGRLTFEPKEPRLKLYASDSSALSIEQFSRSHSDRLIRFGPSARFSRVFLSLLLLLLLFYRADT